MIIKFKYKVPESIRSLMKEIVSDFNSEYLFGYVPEWLMNDLRHCSLYMVCELKDDDGVDVWSEPVVIVAPNEIDALETYFESTNKQYGSILCEITNRCDNIIMEEC